MEAGCEGGNWSAAPELFLLLSLLFRAESGPVLLVSRDAVAPEGAPCDEDVGSDGRPAGLFGGLDVDICGLKVTLRVGLGEGIGRGALLEAVLRRGECSLALVLEVEEAMVIPTRWSLGGGNEVLSPIAGDNGRR